MCVVDICAEAQQSHKLLKMMVDNLECCCPWLMWLDANMLIRMENHGKSVEEWLRSHLKEEDSGAPHAEALLSEMVLGSEPIEPAVIGVVSTAGDAGSHGHYEVSSTSSAGL